jgi:hypothetical protein
MEPVLCPNLVLIEEDNHTVDQIVQLQYAIIARYPEYARNDVTSETIQSALRNKYQLLLRIEDISPYGPDFLIKAPNLTVYIILLSGGPVNMDASGFTFALILLPWTKDFGSTTTAPQRHSCFNMNSDTLQPPQQMRSPKKYARIELSGIPAHLCSTNTVKKLLPRNFKVDHVGFTQYTGYADGYTLSDDPVPHAVTLGVKKNTQQGNYITVWPIWCILIESSFCQKDEPESPEHSPDYSEGN